jgi:hypothetical protein
MAEDKDDCEDCEELIKAGFSPAEAAEKHAYFARMAAASLRVENRRGQ